MKLFDKAVTAINKHGILLVYPIKNSKEPLSLWSVLYPRTPMKWEWTEDSDNRVAKLWMLREELSRSSQVVYAKWYQGRATCFSKEVFVNMLSALRTVDKAVPRHSVHLSQSHSILETLEMDSPLSTKQIKEESELQGKFQEAAYNRAMKYLWQHLYIVGFGEVQDSSFPSLAVGATKNIFEDLWNEAQEKDPQVAEKELQKILSASNHAEKFWKFYLKIKSLNS